MHVGVAACVQACTHTPSLAHTHTHSLTRTHMLTFCVQMSKHAFAHSGCANTVRESLCAESWLWEKNTLPRWQLEPASVLHLGVQVVLPTELFPPLFFSVRSWGNQLYSNRLLYVNCADGINVWPMWHPTEVFCKCWMFFSVTHVWSTWPLQWARVHQEEMILNCWIKLAVKRGAHLICSRLLANHSLSLRSLCNL